MSDLNHMPTPHPIRNGSEEQSIRPSLETPRWRQQASRPRLVSLSWSGLARPAHR